jgi:hypothetical protein
VRLHLTSWYDTSTGRARRLQLAAAHRYGLAAEASALLATARITAEQAARRVQRDLPWARRAPRGQ